MYRSWAYILMVLATLVGIVALLWPSPEVQTIEQIAAVTRDVAPRTEPPPKPAKPVAKAQGKPAAKPAPPPPPPPVVKQMPAPNTTTHRAGPLVQNGMDQGVFGQLNQPGPGITPPQPPPPGAPSPGMAARPPLTPPHPPTAPHTGFLTAKPHNTK